MHNVIAETISKQLCMAQDVRRRQYLSPLLDGKTQIRGGYFFRSLPLMWESQDPGKKVSAIGKCATVHYHEEEGTISTKGTGITQTCK